MRENKRSSVLAPFHPDWSLFNLEAVPFELAPEGATGIFWGMSASASLGYTASLCRVESTELVPYEQVDLTAATDIEAIQKATDWVRTMRKKLDGDSRLIVRLGARAIYSEALMTP